MGPSFTLTQTTGNCALVEEVAGEGNTDWTRLVGRLACLGPSTQYGFVSNSYPGGLRGGKGKGDQKQGKQRMGGCG